MKTAVGPQGEAKEEGADGENTAIGNSGASEKHEEELDKMSLLVLWYGENQESPMYSLIRQSSFTAYEEGIAKGESLVPIVKSTLLRKTPDSDDTTVVCSAGYEGDEGPMTSGGDRSGSSDPKSTSRIKPKPGSIEDFMAAAAVLQNHPLSTGKVGAVGFCYGGGVVNELAVRLPDVIQAGVPFYGRQPAAADVPKIKASLLIHYAGNDTRINDGWPAYEQALKAAGVKYESFIYAGANHGFHNDSTPRFDVAAAKLAWQRTVDFFKAKLV